jgi:hypothetical protein
MRTVCAATLFTVAASDYPMPAVQTSAQLQAFATKNAEAKAASEAATPGVLAFFDSSDFRTAMQSCCPKIASMSSHDILAWINAEALVNELAHSLPASAGKSHFTDGNLDTMLEYGWFLNEWQGQIIGKSASTSKANQNSAATKLFGLPSSPDTGFTWDQAADRLIYVAHNFYQADFGSSPNFGDVTAIFSSSYVKDMVEIAPIDTGRWHMSGCDPQSELIAPVPAPAPRPPHHNENCSSWNPQSVGTLYHHNHMILPNLNHNIQQPSGTIDKAKAFFSRSSLNGAYEDLPAMVDNDYWESNILGHPRLPEGVKFLIGNFPVLFGTDLGIKLQQVCEHYSWPLAWSYGYGSSKKQGNEPGNKRILDPTDAFTNASLSNDAVESFQEIWNEATSARKSGTPSASQFSQWWSSLEQNQVRLAPMTSSSCVDTECIGTVVGSNQCVCKSTMALFA